MLRTLFGVGLALLALVASAHAQEATKISLKTSDTPPAKELSDAIRKELAEPDIQIFDAAGKLVADFWFRKAIPADKAVKSYRDLKQGELFGAVRFHQTWRDYRKQKIKAGVYTLRLAFQPTDGKHTADVSEYPDFLLVVDAKADTNPAPLDVMKLTEESGDSIGSGHPGLFMLAPNPQPGPMPTLAARPRNQWVINTRSGNLGIGLTVVGHTPAE
jgi:hypothetical protein